MADQLAVGNAKIEVLQGDIAAQSDLDAVVNAANAALATGGGVAGAIHKAAGPELYEACKPLAPIKPGEAVITAGFNLPNDYVIHVLGPVYGQDKPEEKLLMSCYSNALKLARENGIERIGFPAISTGAFGYPLEEGAKVAMNTIHKELKTHQKPQLVRMVLFSKNDVEVFRAILSSMQ